MEALMERKALIMQKFSELKKLKIPDQDVIISNMKRKDISSILHKIQVYERHYEASKSKGYG